ncbi:RraA family protein [Halovenus marina]|uniref:RraA family protein n=1 Tax=Halovenus marina TaxID=3396621 RepID=UPI003F563C69
MPTETLYDFEIEDAPRELDIDDIERVERFKRAGYGGNVSDALWDLGITNTVLSQQFFSLNEDQILAGRALPVKLHSSVHPEEFGEEVEGDDVHPQKQMMRTVEAKEDGSILCFDVGGDSQLAHFGEMSCQLAYSHGARGMLCAGNVRDTQYIKEMDEFPIYTQGTAPNAFGGWEIVEIDQAIHLPGHLTHYVTVRPGDFIFGDFDGVQLIPREVVDEVLLRVESIYEKENEEREQIADGMPIDEVYEEFGVL